MRVVAAIALTAIALVLVLAAANLASLDDGISYLGSMVGFGRAQVQPLDPVGRFGACHSLVTLTNKEREQFIESFLAERQIEYERLSIADSNAHNILVRFGPPGELTVFSAHYDKLYDDPEYHGASDNSAAVCVLLAAAAEFEKHTPNLPVALLFTGEEEKGLLGAKSFANWVKDKDLPVKRVLNFDSLGRGGIAARASGERGGYYFTIPLVGEYVYDGRAVRQGVPYRQPNSSLIESIREVIPVGHYDRMVAKSDGTAWEDYGWQVVNLTSDDMYYLDKTWHTYEDRIELLDERNLELALKLVLDYSNRQ